MQEQTNNNKEFKMTEEERKTMYKNIVKYQKMKYRTFIVRTHHALGKQIEEAAHADGRSYNNFIINVITQYLATRGYEHDKD